MATIFSKIINGDVPGIFVYRDDKCVAFMDIEPLTRGHVLVVPIAEVDHWTELDDELSTHLFAVAKRIGQAQKEAFDSQRVGVVIQGFEVPHVHIHVFPTNAISDFDLSNKAASTPEDLQAAADAIIVVLESRA